MFTIVCANNNPQAALAQFTFLLLLVCACVSSAQVTPYQPNISHGGRAVAIAVSPDSDQKILVASETGGLFVSTNGGSQWTRLDALPSHAIQDVAFAPRDSRTVIATAGADFRTVTSAGIWLSQDGGTSWSKPATSSPTAGARCRERVNAYGIAFAPDSNQVYVGTDCGLAISTDLGRTWTHLQQEQSVAPNIQKQQNRVWSVFAQAGGRVHIAADDGVWLSVNGGQTWTQSATAPAVSGYVVHAFAAWPANNLVFFVGSNNHLSLSRDGGQSWSGLRSGDEGWGRPGFVRVARHPGFLGGLGLFDVYFGAGVRLYKSLYPPWADLAFNWQPAFFWQMVQVDHADPGDIAFDAYGTPILVATDGGLHRTTNGGQSWFLAGGNAGYNALQITEVTGQFVKGQNPHTDLYFGTQDNNIWASSDEGRTWPWNRCCEGFYIRTGHTSIDHQGAKVSGVSCGPCNDFMCDPHLQNCAAFNCPPDGDSVDNDECSEGDPFLIQAGQYIFRVANNDVDPTLNVIMLSTDNGTNWTQRGTFPEQIIGRPIIAGTPPVIYFAVRRPGTARGSFLKIGLIRIESIMGPGDMTVQPADGPGFGSLGFNPTMFAWYPVFGVSRLNPHVLIIPDVETLEMKMSYDGGATWAVDSNLTSLVTDHGAFLFYLDGRRADVQVGIGDFMLVASIEFDQDNPCDAMIGTVENGIFDSANGGRTWHKIPGSEQVTQPTSFFFLPMYGGLRMRNILASSYGRGLWKLGPMQSGRCQFNIEQTVTKLPGPALIDPLNYHKHPFASLAQFHPLCKTDCRYLLVHNGEISDIEISGNQVRRVDVDAGVTMLVDGKGKALPLDLPVRVNAGAKSKAKTKILNDLRGKNSHIRGLLLEGTRLAGVITAAGEIEFAKAPYEPYVSVVPNQLVVQRAASKGNDKIQIFGRGFEPTSTCKAYVSLSMNAEQISTSIEVDEHGRFRHSIDIPSHPGEYLIEVFQQTAFHLLIDRTAFYIPTQDVPE